LPETSSRLQLPYMQASQAQKHVTHNEALLRLDLLVQMVVEGFASLTPPSLPLDGQVWALGPAPSGVWAGQGNRLAAYVEGGWVFITPAEGWLAVGRPTGELRRWTGSAWVAPVFAPDMLPGLGINTAYDAVNALAVSAPAALFTHAGQGHQIKVNKADTPDTASLLFQTGFAGRAEMGLAGEDDFSIKVSPDGTTWEQALQINRATGQAVFPQGLSAQSLGGTAVTQSALDTTAGRVLKVSDSATLLSASPALRMVSAGTANAITLATGAGLSGTIPTGLQLRFRAAFANTEATTIAVDGGTAIACRTVTGVALPAGYIRTDTDTVATYDGEFWVLERQTESGSNSNGNFVRWADGTQTCTSPIITSVINITTASAGGFRGTMSTWTYPAAFSTAPSVSSWSRSNHILVGALISLSATGVAPAAWSASSGTSVSTAYQSRALGRWY
jgi:hypothetical protein